MFVWLLGAMNRSIVCRKLFLQLPIKYASSNLIALPHCLLVCLYVCLSVCICSLFRLPSLWDWTWRRLDLLRLADGSFHFEHRLLSVLLLSFSLTPVFFSLYFSSSFPFLSLSISPSSRIVLDRFPILQRNRMCLQDVPNWRLMLVFSQHSLAPFSRWETMPIRDSDFRTPLSRRYLHKQPAARWRTRESSVIYFINICGVQYTCQVWAHDFWLGV